MLGAAAVASVLGAIGGDSRWLAALGNEIVDLHRIPDGVPYAAAPSDEWNNPLVAAELIFSGLHAFGDRGFLSAQLVAVVVAFWLLARDARLMGASEAATAVVLLVVLVAASASVGVIRVQLFSLALFPALLLLLRTETRNPSRRIWMLVPLVTVWGNLHGAVLVGVAVAVAYLLLERAHRELGTALAVLASTLVSLLGTPALLGTAAYYRGVLENEAARRGFGLWAPLSLRLTDLLLIAGAVIVIALALRTRPALWELVVLLALALLTLRTARSGVWLMFFAAAPAALGLRIERPPRRAVVVLGSSVLAAAVVFGVVRGPISTGASHRLLSRALAEAGGTPILAEGVLAEQVALAGGTIWLGNPLDAFRQADQKLYVDWLEGRPSGDRALARGVRVILVRPDSDSELRLRATDVAEAVARDANGVLYRRSER